MECGGPVKVIACIEDPVVLNKILTHRENKVIRDESHRLPGSRAPPQAALFN